MKKKILITGGAGFIGSNLALGLVELGYNVTVIDNLSQQIHGENPDKTSPLYISIKDKVRFIHGSVTSRKDLETAIADQHIIVHFAAETGTGQSMYEIEKYNQINIGGTALLLDILTNKPNKVEKVIVASSRAIYGEGKYLSKEMGVVYPDHRPEESLMKGDFEVKYPGCDSLLTLMPTDEESKIHPSSVYGITKQVQEQLVITITKSIGIAGVAFRYQNVYGPGQSLSNPYTGILSIFSTRIKNNSNIIIFEDGKESRDFVFIDDVIDATILGIEKDEADGQVFNVGTGISVDVMTVANELINGFGIKVPVNISGNYRLGDIRHNRADISKITKLLGYRPHVNFNNGISKFIDWVNHQETKEDNYLRSIEELKRRNLFK